MRPLVESDKCSGTLKRKRLYKSGLFCQRGNLLEETALELDFEEPGILQGGGEL